SNSSYPGRVWQVEPVIDPQSRQGIAKIAVPYHKDLRPGGFASATIQAGANQAPLLPQSAVQSDEKGNYVYIIGKDDKVVRRDVVTGVVSDAGVSIASGLDGSEHVVVSAGAFLNPGQKVHPTLVKPQG
ncbi:MAG: efflux RND transporter periplasmic adaptor subunit, partial [Sphingomonas sp.]